MTDDIKPKIGEAINFMGHRRIIMDVLPYKGKFTDFFDMTLVVNAPFTESGFVQFAYNSTDYKRDKLA